MPGTMSIFHPELRHGKVVQYIQGAQQGLYRTVYRQVYLAAGNENIVLPIRIIRIHAERDYRLRYDGCRPYPETPSSPGNR